MARRLPLCAVHSAWASLVTASFGGPRYARDVRDARTVAATCPDCAPALARLDAELMATGTCPVCLQPAETLADPRTGLGTGEPDWQKHCEAHGEDHAVLAVMTA